MEKKTCKQKDSEATEEGNDGGIHSEKVTVSLGCRGGFPLSMCNYTLNEKK